MTAPIPHAEPADRLQRFRARMDAAEPSAGDKVLALEPERSVPGVRVVGTENPYLSWLGRQSPVSR